MLTKEIINLKIENLKNQELHKVLHKGGIEDNCWWCKEIAILQQQLIEMERIPKSVRKIRASH